MIRESSTSHERIRQGSRRRRKEQKQELRLTILQAAGRMFAKSGYEAFSMRKLAEQIGYTPATLYLYFQNKDDLLFTVVQEGFDQFAAKLRDAFRASDDPWDRLCRLSEAYISFGLDQPFYYQLMFMQRSDFLYASPQGQEEPRLKTFGILQDALQHALDAGALEPGCAESYSDVLWVTMHGIVSLALTLPDFDPERTERAASLARDMIYKAFAKKA